LGPEKPGEKESGKNLPYRHQKPDRAAITFKGDKRREPIKTNEGSGQEWGGGIPRFTLKGRKGGESRQPARNAIDLLGEQKSRESRPEKKGGTLLGNPDEERDLLERKHRGNASGAQRAGGYQEAEKAA